MNTLKIYLDSNVWSRAFDEQTQERVRRETNAFFEILRMLDEGKITILGSVVLDDEIDEIKGEGKRWAVSRLLKLSISKKVTDIPVLYKDITDLGLKIRDAAHIACAVKGGADYFITVDDGIAKSKNRLSRFNIKVRDPIEFIEEVI